MIWVYNNMNFYAVILSEMEEIRYVDRRWLERL